MSPRSPLPGVTPVIALAACLVALAGPAARGLASSDDPGVSLTGSDTCARCHSNSPGARAMRDVSGAGIAPFDLWRGSMMANAARDPVWRAAVSAEVATFPSVRAHIEATCMRCHAPMASVKADGRLGDAVEVALLDGEGTWPELGRDGVSCTVCHQITPEGLGTPESYEGGFRLNSEARAYGPHEDPFPNPMRMMTSFTPTHGEHVLESKLCGSCHTLFTDALDEHGAPTGHRFPEQTPYLEWRNSAFSDEGPEPGRHARTCQSCHAPTSDAQGVPIQTMIARAPRGHDFPRTVKRSPFGRHLFVGGNAFVLGLLRDHAEELGVSAPAAAFERTIAATREQLENNTAAMQVESRGREGDRLELAVEVRNLCGHKFPTGHPSRRAWIRLRVSDAEGRVVFASGEFDARGRILDARGSLADFERVGGPVSPHRDRIASGDQASIYEAIAADHRGQPTFRLLSAATHWKDDRLLPKGWRAEGPDVADVRPWGVEGDADFGAAGDVVTYSVLAPAAEGPYTIAVDLLYQPLGARWLAELLAVDTSEVRRLAGWLEASPALPEVVAEDLLEVR